MYGAEQNQPERKRNVHEQPAVQPAVQLLLARKLAGFLANVFEVGERAMRSARQQSAQAGKGAARGSRVRQTARAAFCGESPEIVCARQSLATRNLV